MKIKFYFTFIILCCFFFLITTNFASSAIIGDAVIWRSSVNARTQQITISGQDSRFIINLFIFANKQSTLQILYPTDKKFAQNIYFLKFTLGKQVFTLKKQNINEQNQILFDTILTTSQLQIFLKQCTGKAEFLQINQGKIV